MSWVKIRIDQDGQEQVIGIKPDLTRTLWTSTYDNIVDFCAHDPKALKVNGNDSVKLSTGVVYRFFSSWDGEPRTATDPNAYISETMTVIDDGFPNTDINSRGALASAEHSTQKVIKSRLIEEDFDGEDEE